MHYLGTISAATTETKDNTTTTTTFVIPADIREIVVQPSALGVYITLGAAATTGNGYYCAVANERITIRKGQGSFILSMHNPTGGTVTLKVFASR